MNIVTKKTSFENNKEVFSQIFNMEKLLFFFLLILFIHSCKSRNDNDYGTIVNEERCSYKNNYELIGPEIKEFVLDDETVNLISYMQYIDSLECLSFLNNYNTSIYFYNNRSSKFLHRIKMDSANSIIGKIDGYYWNNNSIYVYSYNLGIIYWIDSDYSVKAKYSMSNASKGSESMIYPAPYLQTLAPLKKYHNKLLSVGFVTGEPSLETSHNRTVVTILDLYDKSIQNVVNYPELYTRYNWAGGFTYRMPSYDLVDESIIINFPASHYLVKYSLVTGEQSNYYAGSSSIEVIKSFPFPKDFAINEVKAWEWYMNNPSYESILYDRYRKLYYRIARLPLKNYVKKEKGNRKPIVIIILDAHLQYIGEVNLPTDVQFFPTNCYVSKDGFHIQVLTDDENILTFYQYNFKKNEK